MTDLAHPPTKIRIGDREVRRLGFGAMQIPGPMVWGEPKDPDRARATLRRVVDLGIQLVDTSWYYGPLVSNRFIAETLYPYPRDLVIVTKLGGRRTPDKGWAAYNRPDELRKGCEEDLRTLRLERIEVTNLRWIAHTDVPFAEALDAMIDLKKEGKIAHISLSNVTLAQLREGMRKTSVVAVQNLYNVAAGEKRLAGLPHASVADQEQIVDLCAEHGMAFTPFFPLAIPGPPGSRREAPAIAKVARRHGRTEAQIAIAWLLARSPSMLPIPGTSSPDHLTENWEAQYIRLSTEDFAEIRDARED